MAIGHDILSQRGRPLRVIAHQCLGFNAKPNSAAALHAALESSVDEVELDFRLSRDGSLVAAHLPWYRSADGRLHRVAAVTASSAREHGLLTLADALTMVSKDASHKRLRLEVKSTGSEEIVLNAVQSHGLSERVTIVSWHSDSLRRLRSVDSHIRLGYSFLIGCQGGGRVPLCFPRALPALLKDTPVPVHSVNIVPSLFSPTPAFIADVRGCGVEVLLVTSYGLWSRRQVEALAVDGVVTSDPGAFR